MSETESGRLNFRLDAADADAVDAWQYVTGLPTDEFFQRAAEEFLAEELQKPGTLEAIQPARVCAVRQLNNLQGTPMSPEEEELEAQSIYRGIKGVINSIEANLGQKPVESISPPPQTDEI